MRNGRIRINGKKFKPDYRVTEGDVINIHLSLLNNQAGTNRESESSLKKVKHQKKNCTDNLSETRKKK